MHRLNNKDENSTMTIAATIFILAIIAATLSMVAIPVAATTTTTTTTTTSNTTDTTSTSSTGTNTHSLQIESSSYPIQQERIRTTSQTPINQTHMTITYSGNGTLTLPNTTETINITTNGSGIVSLIEQSVYGKETIRTEDGQTASAAFYEIVQLDPATGGGKGITMGRIHTDSTGTIAPLNGTILVGMDDILPNGEEIITIWKWESGIGNNAHVASPPT